MSHPWQLLDLLKEIIIVISRWPDVDVLEMFVGLDVGVLVHVMDGILVAISDCMVGPIDADILGSFVGDVVGFLEGDVGGYLVDDSDVFYVGCNVEIGEFLEGIFVIDVELIDGDMLGSVLVL